MLYNEDIGPLDSNNQEITVGNVVIFNQSGRLRKGVIQSIRTNKKPSPPYDRFYYHNRGFTIKIAILEEVDKVAVVKNTDSIYSI